MNYNLTRVWDESITEIEEYMEYLKSFNYIIKGYNISIEINSIEELDLFIEKFWKVIINECWDLIIYDDRNE